MGKFWRIFLSTVSWAIIVAYLLFAARHCNRQEAAVAVRDVRIRVLDSAERAIITPYMVRLWFDRLGMNFKDKPISGVNTERVKDVVSSRGFVKSASVYTDINGVLHIDITQRRPIARVNMSDGEGFYISADGWILPLQSHYTAYVPIVTGSFELPFDRGYIGLWEREVDDEQKKVDKNYLFFTKLINFVGFVESDPFWSAQIVQINVRQGALTASGLHGVEVEIVPRAGDHLICLGPIDGAREKLERLMIFYRNALEFQGWDAVRYIDLSYDNQIVCRE